jgi:hypothetical protein
LDDANNGLTPCRSGRNSCRSARHACPHGNLSVRSRRGSGCYSCPHGYRVPITPTLQFDFVEVDWTPCSKHTIAPCLSRKFSVESLDFCPICYEEASPKIASPNCCSPQCSDGKVKVPKTNPRCHNDFDHVQCPICLEQEDFHQCRTCKKIFHVDCLRRWEQHSGKTTCPLCQTERVPPPPPHALTPCFEFLSTVKEDVGRTHQTFVWNLYMGTVCLFHRVFQYEY